MAVTHAAFQVAEWKHYINRHYDLIKSRYPGIPGSYTTALIIGRETASSFRATEDPHQYLALVREQLSVDEVLTYDDLVHRARAAVAQLQALADAATR